MKGVMYTDALQGVIMFACMLFLVFSLYQVLGMGFTDSQSGTDGYCTACTRKVQGIGASGLDGHACCRLSAVVHLGYFAYSWGGHRLFGATAVGGFVL